MKPLDIFRRFYESASRWVMGRPHEPLPIHQQIRRWAIATGRDECRVSPATMVKLIDELMAMELVIRYQPDERSLNTHTVIVDGVTVVTDRLIPDGVIA